MEWVARESELWEETCHSAALSTTNPIWVDLGSNPGRRYPTFNKFQTYSFPLIFSS
jgi:hypothetical protein